MEEIENSIYGGARFSVGCATEDEATCMGYQSLTSFARRGDAAKAWNTRVTVPSAEHREPTDALGQIASEVYSPEVLDAMTRAPDEQGK
jgi:hypothetical protein